MNAQKNPIKQQGAALVIVLALLAGSLMIGVSGMNSALIDERLAGNYRAAALAQMAAEKGGSDRREADNFNSSEYSDSCLDLVDSYNLDNFEDGDEVNSEIYKNFSVRYDYRGCDYNGNNADFVVGQVRESDGNLVAEYPLVVGQASGGGSSPVYENLPNGLFDYSLLIGGALAINGGANIPGTVRVGGNYSGNKNQDEIGAIIKNDNNDIINDYGPGGLNPGSGFIEKIRNTLGYEENGSQCLDNVEYNIKYCYGDAILNLEDIEGKQVVVEGEVSINGKTDGEKNTVIISGGNADFGGMGGDRFKGFVWSGGSLVFKGQGGTQYEGSFISAGSSTFNGGLNLDFLPFENEAPGSEDDGGYIWLPL
ncbi:pilus assembly PilX N-terminal domain-containing protein [Halomonas llamarensis]|uniref:Pilus assembly PilX N-terminal domain-containing protein n=1 Tax=Halomonas llamarensis TaxID=2945104 RepID=A0ABT0SPC8_9GAMM|nr:pilus assembly PilX N-terminal domain-containing protein [Halomonas llamarensis]MCL7929667.1 pilus assembly PilX N-terminal domain-containing protein [Halomonas llamarensis]